MQRYAWLAPVSVVLFLAFSCSRKMAVESPTAGEVVEPTPVEPSPEAMAGPRAGDTMRIDIPGTDVGFTLVYIPGGSFDMEVSGQSKTVSVDPFWIGKYEVQHDEYTIYRNREYDTDDTDWEGGEYSADAATRPSPPYTDISFGMGSTGGFPAVSMTQQAALFYCNWLFTKTGNFFRLPTEAEWTLACLAGSEGAMPPSVTESDLGEFAWYMDNSSEKFHRVGQKKPNAYGLYDILGNVAEWTLDNFSENYAEATADMSENPWVAPEKRYGRVVKGGSYDDYAEDCTCRSRTKSTVQWQKRDPQIPKSLWWNTDAPHVGFRLVMPAGEVPMEEIESFLGKAVKW